MVSCSASSPAMMRRNLLKDRSQSAESGTARLLLLIVRQNFNEDQALVMSPGGFLRFATANTAATCSLDASRMPSFRSSTIARRRFRNRFIESASLMVVASISAISSINSKVCHGVSSARSPFAACKRTSIWFEGAGIAMESQCVSLLAFIDSPCRGNDTIDDTWMLNVES